MSARRFDLISDDSDGWDGLSNSGFPPPLGEGRERERRRRGEGQGEGAFPLSLWERVRVRERVRGCPAAPVWSAPEGAPVSSEWRKPLVDEKERAKPQRGGRTRRDCRPCRGLGRGFLVVEWLTPLATDFRPLRGRGLGWRGRLAACGRSRPRLADLIHFIRAQAAEPARGK